MAIKNRFNLTKGKPGANASDTAESTTGFILGGVAVANKLELGKVYEITTPDSLKALGITAAYDTTNQVLVYYHITEFFRLSGEGVRLFIMVVAQNITPAVILADTGAIYAKKMLIAAQGEIRQLAIAINPDTAESANYVDVTVDGINTLTRAAIPAAKTLQLWAQDRVMDLAVLIEGRAFGGNEVTAIDLRGITLNGDVVEYEGVMVVIGQDYTFADSLWNLGKKHAAIGTAAGTLAGISMEQDMGEVETLNLTDVAYLKFINAGLSDHTKIEEVFDKLDMLDDKGYVFPVKYTGVSGYRWNGDHTCVPVVIDADGNMNEHKMSYSRTMNDARRAIYKKLIPKVRTTHEVDAVTGKLPIAKIRFFEALGNEALLKVDGVSGGSTTVDPNSDLFRPPQQLTLSFIAVPYGTIARIGGKIILKTQL